MWSLFAILTTRLKTFGIMGNIGLGAWGKRNHPEPCEPLLPVGIEVFSWPF